jgi:O-acetyl-ADP-ribose deacetylase (regulator of RNase III)
MPTVFLKGDLFRHPGLHALAHGCNCAGSMGKGIAVEFRKRFPVMYAKYKKRCEEGTFKPGDVYMWTDGAITVFNLGTQKSWKTKATLPAVEEALGKMVALAESHGVRRVGLPRIGAGLGALPWEKVRGLLERVGQGTKVELVVFEEFVQG